jgi:SAM-dependent methyltransferase
VLEIKDNNYTLKYGNSRVTRIDVLHKIEGNPKATIVADLTRADHLPGDTYDCIICTQTLQFIYNVKAAIETLYRLLKPNGVLLATIPSITQISRGDMNQWGDYWRFTSLSARLLFEEFFAKPEIKVQAYGNIFSAIAFLHGLACEELDPKELDHHDPDYELLIAVRALKT